MKRALKILIMCGLLFYAAPTSIFGQGNVRIGFFGDTIRKKLPPPPSGLTKEQELVRIIGLNYPVPEINYGAPPKFWTIGLQDELLFSQVSLINWAAGGSGSLAFNAYLNGMANYQKGKIYWENRMQLAYGFVQSFDVGYRKSDDRIILDSKWGYQAYKKIYFSSFMNFTSQFSRGYDYNSANEATLKSKFLAPAYVTVGVGVDWKPGNGKIFSLNFSPLTGGAVIVNADSVIRVKYGNEYNKMVRWELGAQLKAVFAKDLTKSFKVASQLSLFSDYMHNPTNVVIKWDMQADYIFSKYFKASLRTNLIYDDKIKIALKDGHEGPRVQFKEVFGLSFSYTIGTYKK
ncbi:MAG: DUF3078 domain-containing protein [Bacteroidales bacterium]|nr:DUF3078 domain-containing protein [Bacteroidales bacterium]